MRTKILIGLASAAFGAAMAFAAAPVHAEPAEAGSLAAGAELATPMVALSEEDIALLGPELAAEVVAAIEAVITGEAAISADAQCPAPDTAASGSVDVSITGASDSDDAASDDAASDDATVDIDVGGDAETPEVSAPGDADADVDVSTGDVNVGDVTLPTIIIPSITLPGLPALPDLEAPEISLPKISDLGSLVSVGLETDLREGSSGSLSVDDTTLGIRADTAATLDHTTGHTAIEDTYANVGLDAEVSSGAETNAETASQTLDLSLSEALDSIFRP